MLAKRSAESASSAGSSGPVVDNIGDAYYRNMFQDALYTEDGISATAVLEGDVQAIMCNMYLVWCIKAE